MFNLMYTKSNDNTLKNLSNTESLDIEDIQSYIPIYDKFFELTDETSNEIMLKHHYSLRKNLKETKSYNTYKANVIDEKNNERQVDVFKYAPLIRSC